MSGCHVPYKTCGCHVCKVTGFINVPWVKDQVRCPVCLGKGEIDVDKMQTKILEVDKNGRAC